MRNDSDDDVQRASVECEVAVVEGFLEGRCGDAGSGMVMPFCIVEISRNLGVLYGCRLPDTRHISSSGDAIPGPGHDDHIKLSVQIGILYSYALRLAASRSPSRLAADAYVESMYSAVVRGIYLP
jgi:hypothetical protein